MPLCLRSDMGKSHRLVVLGGNRVGKTALIEQLIFGNHVVGVVREAFLVFLLMLLAIGDIKTRLTTVVRVFLRSHVRVRVFVMQGGSCSKGDIYEVVLEIDKSVSEPLQIFDTSGEVSISRRPFMFLSVFVLPKLYDVSMALLVDLYACFFLKTPVDYESLP